MRRRPIPGNRYAEMGRIYEDTTVEALEAHLRKVRGSQNPTLRSNPRYVAEVRRLTRAIAARKES